MESAETANTLPPAEFPTKALLFVQLRGAGLVWLGRWYMHFCVRVGALTELMEMQSLAAEL